MRHPYQPRKKAEPMKFGPSLTVQSEKDSCDLSKVVPAALRAGQTFQGPSAEAFADLASLPDFQTVLNARQRAEDAFAELPSRVRAHFGNRYQNVVAAMLDENRHEELVELGILKKVPAQRVDPPVPPDPASSKPAEKPVDDQETSV